MKIKFIIFVEDLMKKNFSFFFFSFFFPNNKLTVQTSAFEIVKLLEIIIFCKKCCSWLIALNILRHQFQNTQNIITAMYCVVYIYLLEAQENLDEHRIYRHFSILYRDFYPSVVH